MMRYVIGIAILALLGCSDIDSTTAAGNELSDIKPLWEILVEVNKSSDIEDSAIEKVEFLIIQKIMVVRSLRPDVSKLNGSALEGLCAAVLYSESSYFNIGEKDRVISNSVKDYLSSIRPDLESEVRDLKETNWTNEKCPI